jgi:choline-sulfatase
LGFWRDDEACEGFLDHGKGSARVLLVKRAGGPKVFGMRIELIGLLAAMVVGVASATAGPLKPNLLLILTDDQCFQTIRALGNPEIETPNLDRLARQGTSFSHAYNMGGWHGAVCVASRTMLVTGRTMWQAKGVENHLERERAEGRLWAPMLKEAGYHTYFAGKWHVNINPAMVFDSVRNVRGGMPKDNRTAYLRPPAEGADPWSPTDRAQGGFWEGGKHWSEVAGDDAIHFIADAKPRQKPFFMCVAFNAPHDPRQSPQEYVDKYPLDRVAVPENFQPLYPHKDGIGCGPNLRDEKLAPFPRTEHAVKVHRQEYLAIITHLDAQIGRILDALEASGMAENTWIFMTSDHGLAVGQHGLFGKQNLYDHSLRVPFLVAGPGVKAGAVIDAPVYLQDAMATTLEIAGVEKPAHVEFESVLPHLRGDPAAKPREAIYAAYMDLQRAVIQDGWKLIVYPKIRVSRLYHVAEDPLEMRDLAADPAQAVRRAALFKRLRSLQSELGDPLDLRAAFPEL